MKFLSSAIVFIAITACTQGFSKYGRTCKDIGCLSNEQCVMETDPCSYYQRDNECGSYPTCKRTNSNSQKSCSTFVCPPGNVCKMVGSNPKCVDDASKRGHIGYDTSSIDNPSAPSAPNAPSAPPSGGQPLYPSIPRNGETTPRPNIAPNNQGQGYRGGQIGSGYPGQPGQGQQQYGGYPQQGGGGYQQQPYYPNQPYPGYQPNYNGGGYHQQPGGYQQPGYQQPGYQQPNYNGGSGSGGYNGYNNQNRYGQKSSGSSISDQLSNTLKNLGLFWCCFLTLQSFVVERLF